MRFASRLFVGVAAAAVLVPAAFAQTGPDVPPDNAGDSGGDVVIVTGIGPARASDELIANTTSLSAEALTERLTSGT